MNEKLVEHVARAICEAEGYAYIPSEYYDKLAKAVIDAAEPLIRATKQRERAATFDFIREQAGREDVVEACRECAKEHTDDEIDVAEIGRAMLDQIERTQNDGNA